MTDVELFDEVIGMFALEHLLDKRIVLLSSGELRKFQLAQALLASPRLLVIDNPLSGSMHLPETSCAACLHALLRAAICKSF